MGSLALACGRVLAKRCLRVSVRACARTWFGGVSGFVILCVRFLADLRFEVDSRACTLERLGFSTPRVHPGWLGEPLATPDEHGLRCSAPPRQRQPLSPGRGGGASSNLASICHLCLSHCSNLRFKSVKVPPPFGHRPNGMLDGRRQGRLS